MYDLQQTSLEMVKYTENIVMVCCDKNFILNYNGYKIIVPTKHINNIFNENDFFVMYKLAHKHKQSKYASICDIVFGLQTYKGSSVDLNKPIKILYLRRSLSISGDKIKKNKFKFTFVYKVVDIRFSDLFKKITFESEQFKFSVN
ncbi:hypothetical protein CDIK_3284 [Cucumispora dikerogammari]|nr:hypothetical protein CDIK_3284 [Cucumispora dikerogammari]